MRWFFGRRRALHDFADAIRPELQSLRAPAPSDDLLERIMASRASGTRIILPDADFPARRMPTMVIAGAAAAVLVLVLLPIGLGRRQGLTPSSGEPRIASDWFGGSLAFAQPSLASDRPRLPALSITRAAAIRPLSLRWARTVRDSSGVIIKSVRATLSVAGSSVDGVPAWLIVARDSGTLRGAPLDEIDTLFVARDDLRTLRRTAIVRPYLRYDEIRIRQTFRGDSIVGRMNAKGADATPEGRPIARRLPPAFAPYVVDALAPVLFRAVELHRGWVGSASLIGWAVRDYDVFLPIELRVEGDDRIDASGARFDCWRLSIAYRDQRMQYWVRKSDGIAVRMLHHMRDGSTRELILTGEDPK